MLAWVTQRQGIGKSNMEQQPKAASNAAKMCSSEFDSIATMRGTASMKPVKYFEFGFKLRTAASSTQNIPTLFKLEKINS